MKYDGWTWINLMPYMRRHIELGKEENNRTFEEALSCFILPSMHITTSQRTDSTQLYFYLLREKTEIGGWVIRQYSQQRRIDIGF
jgi:hypothetical protein